MLVSCQFFQANHIQNNSLPLVCSWQVERGCLDKIASATVVSVGEAYQDEEARHGHHWLSEAENKRLRPAAAIQHETVGELVGFRWF